MTHQTSFVGIAIVLALVTGCTTAPPPPPDEALVLKLPPAFFSNGVLVSPTGMTLYTFDQDPQGASTCNDDCARTWPAFAAAAGDAPYGDFTIFARDANARQWAYKGKPLYLYSLDHVMGDTGGDKRGNAWHAVRPGM
jgi:predicted lipoprotein with Yx(FWY)xxD motif